MDIEQLEGLALSTDRGPALARLVAGSEDHDYWTAIDHQHHGRLDAVDQLLRGWANRHGDTARRQRLVRRQRLLRASTDLAGHARALADELDVSFDHQPEIADAAAAYPTALDPALLEPRRVIAEAVARGDGLALVTPAGLATIEPSTLDSHQRRQLLERLEHVDGPGLVAAVAAELTERGTRGFGALAIHGRLTLAQLEALVAPVPALRQDPAWVAAVLTRRQPPFEVEWTDDLDARVAYLDATQAFVDGLPTVFAPLQALVRYHRLAAMLRRGRVDGAELRAYLALPRPSGGASASAAVVERWKGASLITVDGALAQAVALAPVGDDEPLVRACVHALLADGPADELAEVVDAAWLTRQRAEVRLLAGDADPRWASHLGPVATAALRARVDLAFAPTNPPVWLRDQPVVLEVDVKHVPALRVRVFRIDEAAWILAQGQEVDPAIDLDGLAAGWEEVRELTAAPMVRQRLRLALDACARPGTYVVELIGGGQASRALIRRGRLACISRPTAAGAAVRVVDERGRACPTARLIRAGHEFAADDRGEIHVPFSTQLRSPLVVLRDGDVASPARLDPRQEVYQLATRWQLDRQSLREGQVAQAVVRLDLRVGLDPVSLGVLEEPYLELVTTDRRGVTARRRTAVVLADGVDLEVELAVPAHLQSVVAAIGGRVRVLSEQQTVDVRSERSFEVATIHDHDVTAAFHLRGDGRRRWLALLGKSGEPRAGRAVSLELMTALTSAPIEATVATDADGQVDLGELAGVTAVTAAAGDVTARFELVPDAAGEPSHQSVLVGDEVVIPVAGDHQGGALPPTRWSVVELRGDAPYRSWAAQVIAEPGRLRVRDLPAGVYRVRAAGAVTRLLVSSASAAPGLAVSAGLISAVLARPPTTAQVAIEADGAVVITVRDGTAATRVHVVATALWPTPALDDTLACPREPVGAARVTPAPAVYLSGRDIGDEYRYVLDRQRQPRRPGVLLDKPALLLNPWALRTTQTATQTARGGSGYGAPAAPAAFASALGGSAGYRGDKERAASALLPGHDFLVDQVRVFANLAPDADGVIRLAAAELGGVAHVVVHVVDPSATSRHLIVRAAAAPTVRDLRLAAPLPVELHLREDRRLVAAPAGTPIVVADRATARVELLDTVDKLYRALCALSGDATLAGWDFLPRWASLSEAERLRLYTRHACHELALFIYGKDRPLFDRALAPYLRAKLHPTFLDRWLLGDDLTEFLEPWRLDRLNALELALLARRHREVGPVLHRRLADAVALAEPDPGADDRLVDTIIAGGALAGDALAMPAAEAATMRDLADEVLAEPSKSAASFGAPPPPPSPAPAAKAKKRAARPADEADDESGDLRREARSRRASPVPMYRAADRTEELAEHNWWHLRVGDVGPWLIGAARLWRDLAAHTDGRFLSPHVVDAATSLPAAMAALAFLDLPFATTAPAVAVAAAGATVTPPADAVAAVIELAPVPGPALGLIQVGQHYLRHDDRLRWDGADQVENYVAGELVTGAVYACQLVLTNPTSRTLRVSVLHQIPAGAIAVGGAIATATTRCQLAAHHTTTIEYRFYLPHPGVFTHYGAQVTGVVDGAPALLAAVPPRALTAVATPTEIDPDSWPHLVAHGSLAQVCGYLADKPLGRVALADLAWRCRDRASFEAITAALAARCQADATVWSYALVHHDRARTRAWLALLGAALGDVGPAFSCDLVTWAPVERATYQHLEYAPLINARAHQLGARRTILNDGLAAQWRAFLDVVAHQPAPAAPDWLAAAHYRFAMDRPDDAVAALAQVPPAARATLTATYLAAYAAVVTGDLAAAAALVAPHVDHPVERWRSRFAALAALVTEATGGVATAVGDPDNREQQLAAAAARTPAVTARVVDGELVIDHVATTTATVRYYRMDLELLFSRQPFFDGDIGRFGFIEPGRTEPVALPATGTTRVALPADLRHASVVVEVVAGAARAVTTHFAHRLAVAVGAAYGRLQVRHADTGAARVAAYVKCYARRSDGTVAFYKDGYTDVCGRFDYASLSTDELDRVARFALLVVDDAAGTAVLEAPPPPR